MDQSEEATLLTEESLDWVGRETGPGEPYTVDAGLVKQFVRAIKDGNPVYSDREAAAASVYKGVPMPPAFLLTNVESGNERNIVVPLKAKRRVRGGDEIIVYRPVLAGETVTANTKVVSVDEKQGRSGPMVFVVTETAYTDEAGELRMKVRTTIVKR